MSSQGPLFPTGIDEIDMGIGANPVAWTDPSFARGTPGDPNAASKDISSAVTMALVGKPAGLGFNIPWNARIDGIELTITGKCILQN